MKRLSMLVGLLLVMVMIAPAYAIKFTVEPAAPIIGEGGTAEVCIYLDDWTEANNVAGVDYYITYNNAAASVAVGTLGPGWEDSYFYDATPAPGSASLGVVNFGTGVAGPKMLLQCVTITCNDGDTDFTLAANLGADGIVLDVVGNEFPTVTEGSIPIDQTPPPPCSCSLTADNPVLQPGTNEDAALTASAAFCPNPPNFQWSEDCVDADFTGACNGLAACTIGLINLLPAPATCTVTVTDIGNIIGTEPPPICTQEIQIQSAAECKLKIYRGGQCSCPVPVEDPAYNRPGRRDIALTCCEEVTFCLCTNCNPEISCPEWTFTIVDGDTAIPLEVLYDTPCEGQVTFKAPCPCPRKLTTIEVCVIDPCSGIIEPDCVTVTVGKAVLGIGSTNAAPGTASIDIPVTLENPDHYVKALEFQIAECGLDADDNLTCYACDADEDRAPNFFCSAVEQLDGTCKVTMWTTENSLIARGDGPVAYVKFNVGEGYTSKDCVCLEPINVNAADQFNEFLCVCVDGPEQEGSVCFFICGDVYPQDCYACASCGDGVVDLFDILETIDFILGLQDPSECQMLHGNVPPGMPPYCGTPSGETNCEVGAEVIDIFDAVVIIDKALGKMNCCDYCFFGKIN